MSKSWQIISNNRLTCPPSATVGSLHVNCGLSLPEGEILVNRYKTLTREGPLGTQFIGTPNEKLFYLPPDRYFKVLHYPEGMTVNNSWLGEPAAVPVTQAAAPNPNPEPSIAYPTDLIADIFPLGQGDPPYDASNNPYNVVYTNPGTFPTDKTSYLAAICYVGTQLDYLPGDSMIISLFISDFLPDPSDLEFPPFRAGARVIYYDKNSGYLAFAFKIFSDFCCNNPPLDPNYIIGQSTIRADDRCQITLGQASESVSNSTLLISDNTWLGNWNVFKNYLGAGNISVPPANAGTYVFETLGDSLMTGDLTVDGNETVTGNENIGGNLTVTGTTTLNGGVTLNGNLDVTGNETIGGTLTVAGVASMNNAVNIVTSTNSVIQPSLLVRASNTGDYSVNIIPRTNQGAYNPITQNNDTLIYGDRLPDAPPFPVVNLVLTTHSQTHSGVRIAPTSCSIAAGSTSITATTQVTCDGTNVVIKPDLKFPDNTIQNSAFTGAGTSAGSYTNTSLTLDSNGKITAISNGGSYLPISGGTITGDLSVNGNTTFGSSIANTTTVYGTETVRNYLNVGSANSDATSSSAVTFQVKNSGNKVIGMLPRAGVGNYNPITQEGDQLIFSDSSGYSTSALTISAYSLSNVGMRINSVDSTVYMSGGGGLSLGTSSIKVGDANGNYNTVKGVLNLLSGTAQDADVDPGNITNVYARFDGNSSGSSTDWAYLRNIGGANQIAMSLDMFDDGDDGRFSIRSVGSSGSIPDTITNLFNINRNNIGLGAYAGQTGQYTNAIAIGYLAGGTGQGTNSVAIGVSAGQDNQASNSVAIGNTAGQTNQRANSVAIGVQAGKANQGFQAVAIGHFSGSISQSLGSVAIGSQAGQNTQGAFAVAIGIAAGQSIQGANSVAIGNSAGQRTQGANSVAIGNTAGQTMQGESSIAIGFNAGQTNQGTNAVAIGLQAGGFFQGTNAIAIGNSAGKTNQGTNAIAIGVDAGNVGQDGNSVAIGRQAAVYIQGANSVAIGNAVGYTNQGAFSVALGVNSGQVFQGGNSVAIGRETARYTQGTDAVAIGNLAGNVNQAYRSVAIGLQAGQSTQAEMSVAIGYNAGNYYQADHSVAIGSGAGQSTQGAYSVAVGHTAGYSYQGANSVAIGNSAGKFTQGANAIAIGAAAGTDNQHANSIVINATGSTLNTATASAFYAKPIRNASNSNALYYNSTSGEVTYDTAGAGGSFLPLAGGTMTGAITFASSIGTAIGMANNSITQCGTIGRTAWSSGEIIQSILLFPVRSITNLGSGQNWTTLYTFNYTPIAPYTSSKLHITIFCSYYMDGSAEDGWKVKLIDDTGGANTLLSQQSQYFNGSGGGGTRSNCLFPLIYIYDECPSGLRTLKVQVNTQSANDTIYFYDRYSILPNNTIRMDEVKN